MKFKKKIELAKAMPDSDLKLSTLQTLAMQAAPRSSTQQDIQTEIDRLYKKGYKISIPKKYQSKSSASDEKFEVKIVGSESGPVIYDNKVQAEKAKRNAELLGFEMTIKKIGTKKESKKMRNEDDKKPQKAPKKTTDRTTENGKTTKKQRKPVATSKASKKLVVKRSEPKLVAPKKTTTNIKKSTGTKKGMADKLLKHSDKDEMTISGEKPIVINGANAKQKPIPKVLRKVAKLGGYTAWDDIKRSGKTFATEKEAKDYAADVLKKTGKIVPVSPTDRQVTHTFKAEEKNKK